MREYAAEFSKLPGFYDAKMTTSIVDVEKFAVGKMIADNCVMCHANSDNQERPQDPTQPYLYGQGKTYLQRQLVRFREKTRKNELMNTFAADLTNANIEALAIYFSQVRR